MKGYRKFVFAFVTIVAIYIIAEMNRPKNLNWDVTLSKDDKDPYGGFILYNRMKDLFPSATMTTHRLPVYNQVNNFNGVNTAYLLIDPVIRLNNNDIRELLNYTKAGNFVFISAEDFGKVLSDTLKFKTMRKFDLIAAEDSTILSFKNPRLQSAKKYLFNKMAVDGYITEFDTAKTIVLGNSSKNDVNFIKMPYGKGAFFIHASPVCFSNYFLVTAENADYAAKALSFLPKNVHSIFWDEYYKLGAGGSQNPLRFLLNDPYLKWAFRIAIAAMIIFVLFEMKRRQRVIPIINPLKNTTLEFVETVGIVYFNQRDNKNIAQKKISYFLEYIRTSFYLPTNHLNAEFKESLVKKSGLNEEEIEEILQLISTVESSNSIADETLLLLNKKIDSFYEKVK
jgi:hypothetical protein